MLYTVGTVQDLAIKYLTSKGDVELRPWWSNYGCMFTEHLMIKLHYEWFKSTQVKAAQWEAQLRADVASYYASEESASTSDDAVDTKETTSSSLSEKESYLAILMLSLRQIIASNVPTIHEDYRNATIFQKEISSDGKINTVDVIYPALPFYHYANPNMLRHLLEPVFEYQENGFYDSYGKFAMHDIGRWYPHAIGYDSNAKEDEPMPVEECGNMIIMAYAYYKAACNVNYLEQHYRILRQRVEYLVEYSLYPEHQTTTGKRSTPYSKQQSPLTHRNQTTSTTRWPTRPT